MQWFLPISLKYSCMPPTSLIWFRIRSASSSVSASLMTSYKNTLSAFNKYSEYGMIFKVFVLCSSTIRYDFTIFISPFYIFFSNINVYILTHATYIITEKKEPIPSGMSPLKESDSFYLFFTFIHKKNSYKKLLFHSAGVLKIRLIQNISNRMYTVYFYLYKYHILYSWKNQYVWWSHFHKLLINLSKCDKINSPTVSPNYSAIIEVSVMCWHHY